MSRSALLNAFSPAHEVIEPSAFAGRAYEIKQMADALQVPGSVPVIYGDRGLGKSSLAVQARLIAMGDNELLAGIGAKQWVIPQQSTFLTIYVTCTDEIRQLNDLLLTIIHELEDIEVQSTLSPAKDILVDRKTRLKVTFKIFEVETTKSYREKTKRLKLEELQPTERLKRELQLLREFTGQSVLIIIDELDRAKNLDGFASFLKAASGQQNKFLLVGIAQNLSDLVVDHASLERQMIPIHMPRMTNGELADIVDRTMSKLQQQGLWYSFAGDARRRLVRLSAGFPWFIHVIGQAALLEANNQGATQVSDDMLITASRNLTNNRFAQHFRDAYQRAVRDSYQREIVLRVCASWGDSDIPTSAIYPVCQQLGVGSATVYRGHLVSESYGEPLMTPSFQQRGIVRFRNEMFKQYINLTEGLYSGVADRVREATKQW